MDRRVVSKSISSRPRHLHLVATSPIPNTRLLVMQERYKQVQRNMPEPSDPDEFFDRAVRDELRIRWYEWFTFPLGALLIYVLLFSFMLFY